MLFCAPKLVWDLLSRPSAQTVHPFICLSVYQSIRPLLRPPFVSFILRLPAHSSVLPSVCSSFCLVCPSVRPPARPPSFHSFVSLSVCPFVSVSPSAFVYLSVCSSRTSIRSVLLAISPSIRLSVRLPNTYFFVLSFVRPSVRPSNHLSIYNGS